MSEYSVIVTTFPDKASAKKLAKLLIEKQLAACVQMLPIESVYLWKCELSEDNEPVLLIKSKTVLFDGITTLIKENHSYEVPETIQLLITDGLPNYLK